MKYFLVGIGLAMILGCHEPERKTGQDAQATTPAISELDHAPEQTISTPHSTDDLRDWLQAAGKRSVLIPVAIYTGPFGIHSAFLRTTPDASPAQSLALDLDDSGMGIALTESIRPHLNESGFGFIWIKGRSGTLLDTPAAKSDDATNHPKQLWDFTVFEVLEAVDENNAIPQRL